MDFVAFGKEDLDRLDGFDLPGWGDLVAAHRVHLEDPICHPHKVIQDGELVGIGTATDLSPTGWLSYIAVRQDLRRRGIGGRIVEGLVRFLQEERACRTLSLVTTEEGRGLYTRAGFLDLTEYVVFDSDNVLPPIPPFSDCILACQPEHFEQVLALDLVICGEDRSSVLRGKMANAFVFLGGSLVHGCFFPDLGDGVIEAITPRAGLELMRFKAMVSTKATILRENAQAAKFLCDRGFRETSRRTRMILGEALRWKPDCVYGL